MYYPTKSLQTASVKIEDIKSVQKLIPDMIETMLAEGGIGLAAPQIGQNIRLAVINKEADSSLDGHLIIINPKIYSASREMEKSTEGCLSIPGKEVTILRHKKIKVRFLDEGGKEQKIKAAGLLGQVFQHEINHLDGILIIDRAANHGG